MAQHALLCGLSQASLVNLLKVLAVSGCTVISSKISMLHQLPLSFVCLEMAALTYAPEVRDTHRKPVGCDDADDIAGA